MSRAVATRAVRFANRWRQMAQGAVLAAGLVTSAGLASGSPAGAQRLIIFGQSLAPAFVAADELPRPGLPPSLRNRTPPGTTPREKPSERTLPRTPTRKGSPLDDDKKPGRIVPPSSVDKRRPTPRTTPDLSLLRLAHIPPEANFVFAIRPAELLALPEFKDLAKECSRADGIEADFGVAPNQLEQFTVASLGTNPSRFLALLYFKPSTVPQKTIDKLFANGETVEVDGQEFRRRRDGRVGCVLKRNPRYAVIAEDDATLQQVIAAGTEGALKTEWAKSWLTGGKAHARLYLEAAVLREKIAAAPQFLPLQEAAALATVAPLWQSVKSIELSMNVADEVGLSLTAEGESPEKASRFFNTFAAVTTFGRNYLDFVRETFAGIPEDIRTEMARPFEAVDALLASMRYEITGTKVLVTMRGEARQTSRLFAGLLPSASKLRVTIQQSNSKKNLKQIITALHNHHDVFNELPAALRYGTPKAKSEYPHSWRVALLPWLEQTQLYNQYKLDEPWDSPANLKILEKMPDVYRDPYESFASTNTPYVALVGEGLAFPGRQAARIRDFSDGLAQTIMVVESEKKVPWTKPEDIPYEADKPFPFISNRHLGRFLAVFGDGSVLAVAPALDDKTLRSLFTIKGGEKVSLDELKGAVD